MEKKSLCMRCMNDNGGYDVCMHCGYENGSVKSEPSHINPGTHIANGRYLVGAAVRSTRTELWYAGYDENLSKRITVREFFPGEIVRRGADSMCVCTDGPKHEEEFTESASRYRSQMRAAASIRNDNVVCIDDVFEENGTVYAVTEYLSGASLSDYAKKNAGRLSAQAVRDAALQLCSAVKALHAAGFIHCGVGFESVSVCDDGRMKLSAFDGIVRIGGSAVKGIKHERGVTAPEIFDETAKPTPQTDVYSIAAALYMLASGKLPEDARDRVLHDEYAPLTGRCSLPDGMCRAIDKALSLEPGKRYRSVYLFENALKTEERQTAVASVGTHAARQSTTVERPAPNVSQERRITQRESIQSESIATTVAMRSTPRKKKLSAQLAVPITAVILIIAIGITLIAMSLAKIANTITCYGLDPDSNEEASVICDELQIKLAQTPDKADVSIGEMPFPSALKISEYSNDLESALKETFSADGQADVAKLSLIEGYIDDNPDDFGLPLAYSPYVIFSKNDDLNKNLDSGAKQLEELIKAFEDKTTNEERGIVMELKPEPETETAPKMFEDRECKGQIKRNAAAGDRVLKYDDQGETGTIRLRWAGQDVYIKSAEDVLKKDEKFESAISVNEFDEIDPKVRGEATLCQPKAEEKTSAGWYTVKGDPAYFRKYASHSSVLLEEQETIQRGSDVYVRGKYKESSTGCVLCECVTEDGIKGYLLDNDIEPNAEKTDDEPQQVNDTRPDDAKFAVIGGARQAIFYIYGDEKAAGLEKNGEIHFSEEYDGQELKEFTYIIASASLYDRIIKDSDATTKISVERLPEGKPYPAEVMERVYIANGIRKSAKLKQACKLIAELLSRYATKSVENYIFPVYTETRELQIDGGDNDVNSVITEIINGEIYLLGE